jgi:hypothetical protein
MKRFLFFAALLVSLPVWGQNKRRVLVEEFTQASCPPCAAQNPAFNEKLNQMADIVTPIKYQTSWPGVDPMNEHNPTEVQTRVTYYGVNGVPNAFVNGIGIVNDCSAYANAPACMDTSEIRTAYNSLTPVSMTLTHSLSADLTTITVNVSVTSAEALSGNLVLHVACTEKDVIFTTAPGTNGELEFYDVMKKMLPSASGTSTGAFTAGETKTYTFTYQPTYYYDLNQIGTVAWLQNTSTKEVYQSEKSAPNTNIQGLPQINIGADVANVLLCENAYALPFTLQNNGNNTLTTASIGYSVGDGAEQTYNWTGNLLPGESEVVTLSGVTAAASGFNALEVRVINANYGIQTNQVNGFVSASMNAMYETVSAPYAEDFEAGVYPSTFGLKNADGLGWEVVEGVAGGFGLSEDALVCDFFNLPETEEAEAYLPRFDLTGALSAIMTFDHAKAGYNATYLTDRLRVEVSKDCGATWEVLFNKAGTALNTAPNTTSLFVPTSAQWKANEISLAAYLNEPSVLIRLRGTSDFGNLLWIDNINVAITSDVKEVEAISNFTLTPNPSAERSNLQFTLTDSEALQMRIYAVDGTLVRSQNLGNLPAGQHNIELDAAALANGSYRVTLQSNSGVSQLQWVVLK